MSKPETGWGEYSHDYSEVDSWNETICDRCEARILKGEPHHIEDCVKSLAKRVRILFEGKP